MRALAASLEFRNISMEFPGVLALDNMSFKAEGGQVVAFLGENGAGKSTLLKILNGDYQQTGGEYYIEGRKMHFTMPQEAIAAGVSIIYQERQIVRHVSVAENVFMGNLPVNRFGLVDYKKLYCDTQRIIDEFSLPIKPTERVNDLSIAHQQMVEIMKAYNRELKIIAFDEPTASLSDKEVDSLFSVIGKLKDQGKTVLYVSHRLKEIFQICDKVIVFKDGKLISEEDPKVTSEKELVRLMVGRDLGDVFNSLDRNSHFGETVLKVTNIKNDKLKGISFSIKAGEILGFSGLVGAGRTELARAVFGADPIESGEIIFEGARVNIKNPEDAIRYGIGLCPEDRKTQGIVPIRSVGDNISMASLKKLCRFGFIDGRREGQVIENGIRALNIKTPNAQKHIVYLSGGNQQKAILARCLATAPKLLILDEPTKGIDVGSKQEIYRIICDLAKQQIAVWIISSELPEIIGICDRIIVMRDGSVRGEVTRAEATEEKLLWHAMVG